MDALLYYLFNYDNGILGVGLFAVAGILIVTAIALRKIGKLKEKSKVQTIVREEVQNDVKIVTKVHRKTVEVDYDVFLQMLRDYEKMKQESQKAILTQLALLEAKKEEERDKLVRDLTKVDDAYKDLVKVKKKNGKPEAKKEEEEEGEDIEVDFQQ